MAKAPTNIAASVKQRLLNIARAQDQLFDVVLVRFALERLLWRLCVSSHRDRFILKDGLLVTMWAGDEKRVTRDADVLRRSDDVEDSLKAAFTEIMAIPGDDGIRFDAESLNVTAIREEMEFGSSAPACDAAYTPGV